MSRSPRQLEQSRIQERKQAIAQGLIADPDKPTSLENAIEFVGTCTEMCPSFEREEREFKKNVHPLEQVCELQLRRLPVMTTPYRERDSLDESIRRRRSQCIIDQQRESINLFPLMSELQPP